MAHHAPDAHHPKRHYNVAQLHADYQKTFTQSLNGLGIFLVIIFIFFFALVFILGSGGHTKHQPFYDHFSNPEAAPFSTRIEIEYKGTKLPAYGDPGPAAAKGEAAH